jgi:hypothetical protein
MTPTVEDEPCKAVSPYRFASGRTSPQILPDGVDDVVDRASGERPGRVDRGRSWKDVNHLWPW